MFFKLVIATISTFSTCAQAASYTLDDVTNAFKANSIVPDVLPSVNFNTLLDLTYGSTEVTPGVNLTQEGQSTRLPLVTDDLIVQF